MNIYWKLKVAIRKVDEKKGELCILQGNKFKPFNFDNTYPLNKWGIGYWNWRHKHG